MQVESLNSKSGELFNCTLCDKKLTRKDGLSRHMSQVHSKGVTYECSVCGSKYKSKFALKRHIETNYFTIRQHKCAVCETSFRLVGQLNHHMKKSHPDIRFHRCTRCFATFKVKGDLQRHIERMHNTQSDENLRTTGKGLMCVLCDKTFPRKSMILFHLENDHNISLTFESHNFTNIDEFYKWKADTEKSTVCQYIKMRSDNSKKCKILTFVCHRSGVYVSQAKKNMRRLKAQGSKKMNGFCPAELSLRQDNENGLCVLTFLKTHVGHPTADETELAHVYLSKEEKRKIADRIAVGTSFDDILNDFHTNSESDKLRILDNHDLHNIAALYNLKVPRREKKSTRVTKSATGENIYKGSIEDDIEEFIVKYSDSILYYKKNNELDDTFPRLKSKDVVVVVMSETQRSALQKFGSNVIALCETYKDESYNFFIQTLMVVDNYLEAFVCAFAVSNHRDENIVDLFLRCMRSNVGILRPRCLITDTQDVFYKKWLQLMSEPQHWLLCSWHVKYTWKKNLQNVSNKERQRLMKEKLFDLSTELDEQEFITKLREFFDMEDDYTEYFFEYFRENFVKNIDQWAHCYRLNVDSNANIYMESFHSILKYLHGQSKKIKKISDALNIFEKYLRFKERLLKIREIRGRLSNKIKLLRKRHDYVSKNTENYSVERNVSGDWIVYSHSSVGDENNVVELFSVQCVSQGGCPVFEDCKLICEKCEICAHQYKCSCSDSRIKNNMCQHVHIVCLHKKTLVDTNTELFVSQEVKDVEVDEIALDDFNSSHINDFSKEVLNSPRTLSATNVITESATLAVSIGNEIFEDDLLAEIPFCDIGELEDEKARLKEAFMSAAAVVDTASSEADLCFIKEVVTPAILRSTAKEDPSIQWR